MKEDKGYELEKQIEYYYPNNEIVCGKGNLTNIAYKCEQKKYDKANMLVYYNINFDIAIIWNLERRRKYGKWVKTQSLGAHNWNTVLPIKDEIKDWYKKMGTGQGDPYEKVIVMSYDTLIINIDRISDLLKFDSSDSEIPKEVLDKEKVINRPKRNIETWNRDRRFRRKILEAYGKKCAICRCNEEKILQAAHIKAVSDYGSDDKENGICLCANHHLMFDNDLIKIDFKNLKLTYVADSVKTMPWYDKFIKEYNGRILKAK